MPKTLTSAMERVNRQKNKNKGSEQRATGPWIEAWARIRRNRLALFGLIVFVVPNLLFLYNR